MLYSKRLNLRSQIGASESARQSCGREVRFAMFRRGCMNKGAIDDRIVDGVDVCSKSGASLSGAQMVELIYVEVIVGSRARMLDYFTSTCADERTGFT